MKMRFITFAALMPDNEAFVKKVLAKTKPKKVNLRSKKYIDKWIMCHYEEVYLILDVHSFITMNGLSALDRLNDTIEKLYHDPELSFKSQKEADEFLNRELYWKRFTIQLRTN